MESGAVLILRLKPIFLSPFFPPFLKLSINCWLNFQVSLDGEVGLAEAPSSYEHLL